MSVAEAISLMIDFGALIVSLALLFIAISKDKK